MKKSAACLKIIQRLATRIVEGQKGKSCARKPKDLNLYSTEGHRFRGDVTEIFKLLRGLLGIGPDNMFREAAGVIKQIGGAKLW